MRMVMNRVTVSIVLFVLRVSLRIDRANASIVIVPPMQKIVINGIQECRL